MSVLSPLNWNMNGKHLTYKSPHYSIVNDEKPFRCQDRHYLSVKHNKNKKFFYYCFEDKQYISESEMHKLIFESISSCLPSTSHTFEHNLKNTSSQYVNELLFEH